jgi:hypothetical protein
MDGISGTLLIEMICFPFATWCRFSYDFFCVSKSRSCWEYKKRAETIGEPFFLKKSVAETGC